MNGNLCDWIYLAMIRKTKKCYCSAEKARMRASV